MVRIKVCGMTRLEDALAAIHLGADAIGLVFYPKSPRYIAPERAARLVAALPPLVSVVGLFVNHPREEILHIVQQCHLSEVQLHGDESPADCLLSNTMQPGTIRVIKAVRVATPADLQPVARYPVAGILLDAKTPHAYGGTGMTFDWSILSGLHGHPPLILAGGLNPNNVARAIRIVKPYGVDVSSGVESSPGIKDHDRMQHFITCARQAGAEVCA
ncbi:MAG: phosphoribosylanthranilate isomerase [Magnetococcales bacterium]|nr:phosphoribosylanthranilate isomerase [Magnetococcales bacterium]